MYDYLAEFVALVQEGTFTKAAAKLGFSQPVLSRHMSALEAELGCTLLNRSTHGFTLTEAGTQVLRRARDIVEIGEEIRFGVAQEGRRPASLAICGTLANTRLLSEIRAAATALGVSFTALDLSDELSLEETFAQADVLFAFLADPRLARTDARFAWQTVYRGQLVMSMGRDNPLAARSTLAVADIAECEMWRPEGEYLNGLAAWEEYRRVCREAGFYPKSRAVAWEGPNSVYALDLNRMVTPVVPGTPLEQYARESGCAMVPVEGMAFPVIVGVHEVGNAYAARLVEQMADALG